MTLTCPYCGQEARAGSRFCPRCGRPLDGRLQPGEELKGGDYCIVRSLTKGGMGAVYLAHDRRAFDRLCVIKQMLEYYDVSNPEERAQAEERFEEEGRTLASMSHPGIPRIYAFFQENGHFYIVMEYVQGENLESFVTHEESSDRMVIGKRLPQEEIIRYIIQACRILEYLHAQPRPVLHLDLKPANLILESQLGEVRLVDFGTAHAEMPQGVALHGRRESVAYGTDGYAPPEQYRGKPVPRSDVFALAATAYHLLTDDDPSEHPFKWPKLATLPRELAVALERALRTVPEQRSTATELRQALEAWSTPRRLLEAFTFPGGNQIRSVAALPSLCDEYWDAARSFLYHGDFQRWLRDINRHDLVLIADDIVAHEKNRDAGLEAFLRAVDPGLPCPKITVDPAMVDLGAVARESALFRRVTVVNVTRGYVQASVSSSRPWIETYPEKLDLLAKKPVDIRVNVRAENLPFRSQQRGAVSLHMEGQQDVDIPVTATVSLTREVWRLTWRAISASIPESWRALRAGWRLLGTVSRGVQQPLQARPWLLWVVWAVMSIGIAAGLYFVPASRDLLGAYYRPLESWADYLLPVLMGPPLIVSLIWLALVLGVSLGTIVWGALRGAWKSFFR